jgi:hypothetical protein
MEITTIQNSQSTARGRFTAFPVALLFSFDVWPPVGLGLKVKKQQIWIHFLNSYFGCGALATTCLPTLMIYSVETAHSSN